MQSAEGPVDARSRPTADLWETMQTARAVRRYRPDPVDPAIIRSCLQAATWAPSGGNQQPWRFVLLESPEVRSIIGEGARRTWEAMTELYGAERPPDDAVDPRSRVFRAMYEHMAGAATVPVCILCCVQPQRGATDLEQGGSIFPAIQNFLLAARAYGLGAAITLWHRQVDDELRSMTGIPNDWTIAATVTAGWPRGGHGPVRRKPAADVICIDRWND